MSINDKFDWLKSSNADRALLFKAINELDIRGETTWNAFLHKALGRKLGEDYEDNFRRGKNSRKDCVKIAALLLAEFPHHANELAQLVAPKASLTSWELFFRTEQVEGCLAAVRKIDDTIPVLQNPPGHTRFKEGEPFYLQIETPVAGQAVCLRGFKSHWHLQPLSPAVTVPVEVGRQWLTRNIHLNSPNLISIFGRQESTNEPTPIYFKSDTPWADFAVIVASAATTTKIVNFFDPRYPLERQYLNALPDVIRSSASNWFIASLELRRTPDQSKFIGDQ